MLRAVHFFIYISAGQVVAGFVFLFSGAAFLAVGLDGLLKGHPFPHLDGV